MSISDSELELTLRRTKQSRACEIKVWQPPIERNGPITPDPSKEKTIDAKMCFFLEDLVKNPEKIEKLTNNNLLNQEEAKLALSNFSLEQWEKDKKSLLSIDNMKTEECLKIQERYSIQVLIP